MEKFILAFLAGGLGAVIGGTATFVMTGFIGIVVAIMSVCNCDVTSISDLFLNLVFMPCVIFNGAVAATAFSANKLGYNHGGEDGSKSMLYTKNPLVLVVGCIFGLIGYLVYLAFNKLGVPGDLGAFSVMSVGFLVRFLFGTHKWKNHEATCLFKDLNGLLFQVLYAGIVSYITAYFVRICGIASIGFSISALSLIFGYFVADFPVTHHTTLIAGYAIMQTGNMGLAVLFGIIAQLIFVVFSDYFNTKLDTHVDGPAVAIAICSAIIFGLF